MTEPIDIYTDNFQVSTGPFGCTLNFLASNPTPPAPGTSPQITRLATVRTSLEHLKLITFLLRNQIRAYEDQSGVTIQIPVQVLNSLRISPEDWDAFWKKT
jgi:hypothetical protein